MEELSGADQNNQDMTEQIVDLRGEKGHPGEEKAPIALKVPAAFQRAREWTETAPLRGEVVIQVIHLD